MKRNYAPMRRLPLLCCGLLLAAPAGAAGDGTAAAIAPDTAAGTAGATVPVPAARATRAVPAVEQVEFGQPSPVNHSVLKVRCRFTAPMDTLVPLAVTCGTAAPFTAVTVPGAWETPQVWSGRIPVAGTGAVSGNATLVVKGADAPGYPFAVTPFFAYYRALALLDEGEYQPALAAVGAFITARPAYGDGYAVKGKILEAAGRSADAEKAYATALDRDPLNVDAAYRLAEAALRSGRTGRAAELTGRIRRIRAPGTSAGPYKNGGADALVDAVAPFDAGTDGNDGSATSFILNLALVAVRHCEWDRAEKYFTDLAASAPAVAAHHARLGRVLLLTGRDAEAEKHLFRALSADSSYAPARFDLGVVMSRRDSVQAAVSAFKPFLTDPHLGPAARMNTALAMARAGKTAEALRELAQLGADGNADPTVPYNAAVLQLAGGNAGAAERTLQALPAETAGCMNPAVAWVRGALALAQGKPEAARAQFRRALTADPLMTRACLGMGDAFSAEDKFIAAQTWYQRAVGFDPACADGHRKMGRVYGRLGMKDKELAAYARAAELVSSGTRDDAGARVLAVTSFRQSGGSAEYAWLGIGLAEALNADLKKISGIRLAERLRVERTMQEKALAAADLVSSAPELGSALEAEAVITGTYAVAGRKLSVTAQVVGVSDGRVLGSVPVEGDVADVLDLERQLGLALVRAMGQPVAAEERNRVLNGPGNAEALRFLAEGRAEYYRGNLERSLAAMRKAVELDAGYLDELSDMDLVSDEEKSAKTLAVLEFGNSSGDGGYDWMRSGIAEALITDLKKVTGLYLVERMDLKKAMDEINLGMTDLVDEGTAPEIGKMVGAGVVLVGAYQVAGSNVRIDARMVDAASGGILMGETVQGPLDNVFELEEHLAFKIADRLNIAVSLAERESIVRKANPTFNALRSIAIAQSSLADDVPEAAYDMAVLRFANAGGAGARKYDWMQAGIHQALTSEFRTGGMVKVLGQRIVEAQAGQQALVRLAGLNAYDAVSASRVPADLLVQGEYLVEGEQVTLKGRIVNAATGDVLVTGTCTGAPDDPAAAGLTLAGKMSLALRDRLSAPARGTAAERGRGYVPLWWGYAATGALSAVAGYYAYRFGSDQAAYEGLTAADPAADWDYWDDARNGSYRSRNFFIGMTVTAAAGTGASWIWNRFLRRRFMHDAPDGGMDDKVARAGTD